MAIESKEILSYLGFPEAEVTDIEKFKEKFNPTFIKKDVEIIRGDEEFHGKILGATMGGVINALKRALKKHGVKTDEKAFEGKTNEVVENIFDTVATGYTAKISELETLSGKGNDEKLTKLQSDFEALKKEKEEVEVKYNTVTGEYETFKTTSAKQFDDYKINSAADKVMGSFKWANGVNDLVKEGFRARIEKKYKPAFDEKGTLIALNDKGEKIPNPKTAGTYKTYEEAIVEEGVEAKIYAIADNKPTPAARQAAPAAAPRTNGEAAQKATRRTVDKSTRPQAQA